MVSNKRTKKSNKKSNTVIGKKSVIINLQNCMSRFNSKGHGPCNQSEMDQLSTEIHKNPTNVVLDLSTSNTIFPEKPIIDHINACKEMTSLCVNGFPEIRQFPQFLELINEQNNILNLTIISSNLMAQHILPILRECKKLKEFKIIGPPDSYVSALLTAVKESLHIVKESLDTPLTLIINENSFII